MLKVSLAVNEGGNFLVSKEGKQNLNWHSTGLVAVSQSSARGAANGMPC